MAARAVTSSVRVALHRAAPLCPALIASPGLLSGLVEAMIQYVLGVRRSPAVWQQTFQQVRAGVHRQLQDDVVEIGPRLDPVPLRSRYDRVDHRRSRTRLFTPQEQPILATNGLIPHPSL